MKLFGHFRKTDTESSDEQKTELTDSEARRRQKAALFHEDDEKAYLTDENGTVFIIDHFPFCIGRRSVQEGNDLSLPDIAEISGIHAAITFESGRYYLSDQNSTNGTFIAREDCELFSEESRVDKEEIHDGNRFYLYRTEFTFHVDIRSSQTCLITDQNAETLMLDQCGDEPEAPPAVISTENGTVPVYGNGYTGENFRIERSSVRNRTLYFITFTVSADIEGEAVEAGDRTELFSGCHFRANGKEYTFLIR